MDINKMIKGIRITAVILVVVTALAFGIGGYYNYKFYKGIVNEPVASEYDTVMTEWLSDYSNDIELQKQWQADVIEAQIRLEKLGVEFEEENN